MRIEFLYWEECPSHPEALARLRAVLRDERLDLPVEIIKVETDGEAATWAFPGSPTIRIDGADIQPPGENPVGLSCRVYHADDGRVTPLPTEAMIRRAVRTAVARRTASTAAVPADAAPPPSSESER
jgi:hypothetical protein